MTHEGHVRQETVVLDQPTVLEEGTHVRTEVLPAAEKLAQERIPSFAARRAPVTGEASTLPADVAENHDHYFCGARKR